MKLQKLIIVEYDSGRSYGANTRQISDDDTANVHYRLCCSIEFERENSYPKRIICSVDLMCCSTTRANPIIRAYTARLWKAFISQ